MYFILLPCVWRRAVWGAAAATLSPGAVSQHGWSCPRWAVAPGRLRAQGFPFPDHNRQWPRTAPAQPEHFIWNWAHRAEPRTAAASVLRLGTNIGGALGADGNLHPQLSLGLSTTAQENQPQILASSQHPQAEPLGVDFHWRGSSEWSCAAHVKMNFSVAGITLFKSDSFILEWPPMPLWKGQEDIL